MNAVICMNLTKPVKNTAFVFHFLVFLTGIMRFIYLLWCLLLRLPENSGPGMLRTETEKGSVSV